MVPSLMAAAELPNKKLVAREEGRQLRRESEWTTVVCGWSRSPEPEDFASEKDTIFCGVFDGHGPFGHKVAGPVRDALPIKLSSEFMSSQNDSNVNKNNVDGDGNNDSDHFNDVSDDSQQCFSSWKAIFVKAFEEMDKELSQQASIDCICSGTTAVSIVKQREHLLIANLGDSWAVLCTRDDENQPVAVQLTVDLKPNVPSEAERIKSCKGRVFALEEEALCCV